MRWAVGRGQTRKGPVRVGRRLTLPLRVTTGLEQGGFCVRKVTGWGRRAGRKQGWEQQDRRGAVVETREQVV